MSTTETITAAPSESDRDREAQEDREVLIAQAFEKLFQVVPESTAFYALREHARGTPGDATLAHLCTVWAVCCQGQRYDEPDGSFWWQGSNGDLVRHNYPPSPRPE